MALIYVVSRVDQESDITLTDYMVHRRCLNDQEEAFLKKVEFGSFKTASKLNRSNII